MLKFAKEKGFNLEVKYLYYDTNKSNRCCELYGVLNANGFKHFKEHDGIYGSYSAGLISAPSQMLLKIDLVNLKLLKLH